MMGGMPMFYHQNNLSAPMNAGQPRPPMMMMQPGAGMGGQRMPIVPSIIKPAPPVHNPPPV